MNVTKQYFRYVSQNIFGLIGTSCYILADTYFIAQAAGTDGVAMLNLCLPIYNFIFAFGSMIGLGSATRYAILKAQNDERAHRYFSNGLMCAILIAVPFMLVGAFCPDAVLRLMGGDAAIVALGLQYTRIFLLFTPFFMCNYIVSAFTRNDGDPSLAMVATLSGSLFNVVFDYIFIFPMGWGLPGAALATAISPVISISICSLHFRKPTNGVQFVRQRPSARLLLQSCQLGISGFVGEMSSAVTTTVFNLLLLRLAGNVAVAAYGVVANFALVATAIHEKHIYKEYIGLDACAANLMRPAMYGAYHHITVLGKEDAPCDHKYDVVGGLCENNDKFAVDRMLPKIDIGDIIYIHDTGAHGSAMGYNYNGKLRSAEVLLCEDGSHRLIRRAETPRDYFATLDFLPAMKSLFED